MSDTKTTALSDVVTPASGDLVPIVDVSDTTMSAGGTNKKATMTEVMTLAPVQSVASKTGAVTLVKGDVGLGSVDNTADASKTVAAANAIKSATTTVDTSAATAPSTGQVLTATDSTHATWQTPTGGGGGGGQWTLFKSGTLTASSATAITGLDGDTDGTYKLFVYMDAGPGGGCNCKVQLNNDATVANYAFTRFNFNGTPAQTSATSNGATDGFDIESNFRRYRQLEMIIHPKTGKRRPVSGTAYQWKEIDTVDANFIKIDFFGFYLETATNLTEIDIMNGFSATYTESYYKLYKLT